MTSSRHRGLPSPKDAIIHPANRNIQLVQGRDMSYPEILHHGAVNGVTGSCHELRLDADRGILIDCGLFQGAEVSHGGASLQEMQIEFPVSHIKALVITHVHLDHVGRLPYLIAAGFHGPIYCSQPSALLLPEVLEDAVRIGFTRNGEVVEKFIGLIRQLIRSEEHTSELQSRPHLVCRLLLEKKKKKKKDE